jgi:adenylyltransferase/sulfurtransferase
MSAPPLSPDELRRYARHLSLPEFGLAGQERLARGSVLLVGAGGLGSPAALYLAAAGVGRIGIVDGDRVDASNLQRQVLHGSADIGRAKTDSAAARLHDLNPHVRVETFETTLTSANALQVLRGWDVVVDGSDNFPTRYLVNDACVLLGVPLVYGSVHRFEGQASLFHVGDAPCYRCLFPEPPSPGTVPSCAEAGVLGVLPGLIGTIQATEAIKLLAGIGHTLAGRLLLVDALRMQMQTVVVKRDPACPACGTREITALVDYDAFCGVAPAAERDDGGARLPEMTPEELATRLARGENLDVVDVREPFEWAIARLPGARLVPLGTVPDAADTFPRDRDIVVYCHHGMRSAAAVEWLRGHGVARVHNLAGGIDRWSVEVDAGVPRY